MPENVITVENFSKSFGDNEVVSDLSFEVQKGEIFAFLGANGSGKTTTIRCLLNILKPSNGALLIKGKEYGPEMARILGYLPEERGLHGSEKVLEIMTYFGELKGLSHSKAEKWSKAYLEQVELADKAGVKIKKISSGQQQKVQLGITIINNPEILVLDEPTKGLDPVNQTFFINMLMEMKDKGSTIVFITHQMEEVEKIADRLLMIKDGKKILYGEVDEVKEQFGENRVHLTFKGDLPENKQLYVAQEVENNVAELIPNENITPKQILQFLLNQNIKIIKFEVALPSLNEIFVTVSKKQ